MRHAQFDCSRRPLHYDRSSHRPTWRITFGDCGIRSHQTSTFDPESLSPACTQSPRLGSADGRILFAVDQAEPSIAISDRIQAIDPVLFKYTNQLSS